MSKRPRDHSHIERPAAGARSRAPRGKEPRKLTIDVPAKPGATPPPADTPAPKSARFPLVVFALIALLGLGSTSAALMIYVMTGGRQKDFSEEVLAKSLVPVEPAPQQTGDGTGEDSTSEGPGAEEGIDLSTPNIIPTRGDPIIVTRQRSVARQLVKVEGDRAKPMAALKLDGDVFSLSDNLGAVSASFAAGVPGSQVGFAMSGADQASEDDSVAPAAADGGQPENATVVSVAQQDDGEPQSSRIVYAHQIEADTTVADFLAAVGFDSDMAKRLDTEAKQQLGIAKLDKSFGAAAVGVASGAEGGGYVPVQFALFKDGQFFGALAINEADAYVPAANPWFDKLPFQEAEDTTAGGTQRLLDAIYAASVRNKLPTTVAGEIIMLLSRAHDLEQPATGDETMRVLYTSKARDKKSGLGRVLYVRVDRGSDELLECFAFQLQPRKPFDCISGDGEGAATDGMTLPVKGVPERKFGPGRIP